MASLIDRTYAEGLFELACDKGLIKEVNANFYDVVKILEKSEELRMVLANPNISKSEKKELLDKLFAFSNKYLLNFLKLLVDKNRLGNCKNIYLSYFQEYIKYYQIQMVEVTSANSLSDKHLRSLQELFEKKLKKEVQMIVTVDPELLGGLRVKINDEIIDNSLNKRLDELKKLVVNS